MNYLAHLFLSKDQPEEQVGNFIGDFVKGARYKDYPPTVAVGVILHRSIDSYTDSHPVAMQSSKLLKPIYKRYSGVVADVLYDHFLAKNFHKYVDTSLERFEKECYTTLFAHYHILPDRVKGFLPRMRKSNRLQMYAQIEGIYESLDIMANYSSLPDETLALSTYFVDIKDEMEEQFIVFFNELLRETAALRERAKSLILNS